MNSVFFKEWHGNFRIWTLELHPEHPNSLWQCYCISTWNAPKFGTITNCLRPKSMIRDLTLPSTQLLDALSWWMDFVTLTKRYAASKIWNTVIVIAKRVHHTHLLYLFCWSKIKQRNSCETFLGNNPMTNFL